MAPDPERVTDISRERTHVGARTAVDADIDHGRRHTGHRRVAQVDEVEGIDRHLALRDLDVLARAHALVRTTPVDTHGAHRTGTLAHDPAPRRHGLLDSGGIERGTAGSQDLSLRIVAARRHPEGDGRDVLLALSGQVAEQSRGRTEPQDEHAGGEGVQGAGMTDPARAPGLARAPDDGVRRRPLGLVHHDDAVGAGDGHPEASSSSEGCR